MFWILLISTFLFCFFDFHYFWRGILMYILALVKRTIRPVDALNGEVFTPGICLTTDLDLVLHMNNARYLRECDFARFDFWITTGIYQAVRKLKGRMLAGASTIRYRKSIDLFDTYNIITKLLCWDDKAFYVEQKFVRNRDSFVCAVVTLKQTWSGGISPQNALDDHYGRPVSPLPTPEHVKHWIHYNNLSSEILRKSS
ncbi:unnamed protein product [Owenia fusiformis]|uniref:Protein THEM6 n=1 Tax=Owenia fusiformis TaxID=6347 RepID=A0A8J1TIG6_OWEFU|nr:unnamed protein product [Owenia fusiformis]